MNSSVADASIVGPRALRNGVIHKGAVALLLGAALAANGAHAAENEVERDETVVRPAAPPSPPAPPARPATPATAAAPTAPTQAGKSTRTEAEISELDSRLRDAQERLNKAASEVAALASERAADAMERFNERQDFRRRSIIGVQLSPDSKDGAKVVDVSPGGPAEEAGIRAGDVIVQVNGKDVKPDKSSGDASRKVVALLHDVRPDDKVKVRVMRDGKPKDFEVEARPFNGFAFASPAPFVSPPDIDPDAMRGSIGPFNYAFGFNSALSGLEVTTLTPELGRYFGTSKGVLVVRAPKGDVYKLQDGDVIVSIDGREPTSGSHITRILSSYQPGEQLTLRVMRDRKAQDIVVTIPERTRQGRVRTTWLGEPM